VTDLEAWAAAQRIAQRAVLTEVQAVLGLSEPPRRTIEFARLGMDSLGAIELRDRLCRQLDVQLPTTIALDHPTVRRLSSAIAEHMTADAAADLDAELDAVLGRP
jgi:pimaricinolide synthase PimS1